MARAETMQQPIRPATVRELPEEKATKAKSMETRTPTVIPGMEVRDLEVFLFQGGCKEERSTVTHPSKMSSVKMPKSL